MKLKFVFNSEQTRQKQQELNNDKNNIFYSNI